jgi:hypothetical protein
MDAVARGVGCACVFAFSSDRPAGQRVLGASSPPPTATGTLAAISMAFRNVAFPEIGKHLAGPMPASQ